MLKYISSDIVFQEVPKEISLAINITNCPCNCKGCHSSWLAKDIGIELTISELNAMIKRNPGVTCICFMGGDSDSIAINNLAHHIKTKTDLKVCWYSGRDNLPPVTISNFDYIKIGRYDQNYGPLTSKSTNQIMYKVLNNNVLQNITNFFQK